VVRGRLYEMPSGIPVLEVPETDIIAHGTADPLADVATQAPPAGHLASYLEPMPESATAGDWGPVYGELLTFDDPSTRLPAIDRLEGFSPEGRCFYRRVLFPVSIIRGSFTVAWVYVGEEALNAQIHWQLKEIEEWNPERK
jgi:AIG2-like family.